MPKIVFPVTHSPGLRASEGGGRLLQLLCRTDGRGRAGHRCPPSRAGPGQFRHHDAHGLPRPDRGGRYALCGLLRSTGEIHQRGRGFRQRRRLNGTKKGFFAKNNAATPDKVFVDPDGNIATFTGAAVTNGFDADLPAVNSVAHWMAISSSLPAAGRSGRPISMPSRSMRCRSPPIRKAAGCCGA
jgi:hypothetical protein